MNVQYATNHQAGLAQLHDRIASELNAGRRVLWLVPGGSNIPLTVSVMDELRHTTDKYLAGLTLMLTDERYGPLGHPDSNYYQLKQAGLVTGAARFIQTLAGTGLEETVRYYGQAFNEAADGHPVVIGQFGIGADGHIAGVLPHSPAAASAEPAAGYDAGQFVRLTLTFLSFRRVTAAYAFAFGAEKSAALTSLQTESRDLQDQPCHILKELPEATLFTDQINQGQA